MILLNNLDYGNIMENSKSLWVKILTVVKYAITLVIGALGGANSDALTGLFGV